MHGPLFRPPQLAAWSNRRYAALLVLAFLAGAIFGAWIMAGVRP